MGEGDGTMVGIKGERDGSYLGSEPLLRQRRWRRLTNGEGKGVGGGTGRNRGERGD